MPEAYEIHDARFVSEEQTVSAGNALILASSQVPKGMVRTILQAGYLPNAAETKIINWFLVTPNGTYFPIAIPISILLNPSQLPLLTDGMELRLYPGDKIEVQRDSATLNSVMILTVRFIETDLPYYSYEEPLRKVVRQSQRHGSVYRSTGGVSEGGGVPSGGHVVPEGGGGGVPQPV